MSDDATFGYRFYVAIRRRGWGSSIGGGYAGIQTVKKLDREAVVEVLRSHSDELAQVAERGSPEDLADGLVESVQARFRLAARLHLLFILLAQVSIWSGHLLGIIVSALLMPVVVSWLFLTAVPAFHRAAVSTRG